MQSAVYKLEKPQGIQILLVNFILIVRARLYLQAWTIVALATCVLSLKFCEKFSRSHTYPYAPDLCLFPDLDLLCVVSYGGHLAHLRSSAAAIIVASMILRLCFPNLITETFFCEVIARSLQIDRVI